MRSSRLAAVVGTVLGALLLLPGSATAGGPTSVLIVSPEHRTTASLYATDEDYGLLARALGENPVPEKGAPRTQPGRAGPGINVTWMIHDVLAWRVDHVLVDDSGEVLVYTQESVGGGLDLGSDGVWHRSAHPGELRDLLARLGVLGSDGAKPLIDAGSDAAAQDAAVPATAQGSTEADPAGAGSWTLPALAGGIVVGVLGDQLVRRRRGERRDRWELVDASPTDHVR